MKTKLTIGTFLLAAVTLAQAQSNDLSSALQKGLFQEEAAQDLAAAIQSYQAVASQFDKTRQIAATAIFRLGECYRKLGRTNEAGAQYQRVLSEFADQATLATLSRQNLAGLGLSPVSIATAPLAGASTERQRQLLEEEIKAADAEHQEISRIQDILQNSPDLINAPGKTGPTLLQIAAAKGQLEVAKMLLDHGADVNGIKPSE